MKNLLTTLLITALAIASSVAAQETPNAKTKASAAAVPDRAEDADGALWNKKHHHHNNNNNNDCQDACESGELRCKDACESDDAVAVVTATALGSTTVYATAAATTTATAIAKVTASTESDLYITASANCVASWGASCIPTATLVVNGNTISAVGTTCQVSGGTPSTCIVVATTEVVVVALTSASTTVYATASTTAIATASATATVAATATVTCTGNCKNACEFGKEKCLSSQWISQDAEVGAAAPTPAPAVQ